MSAFQVSDAHISYLIAAIRRGNCGSYVKIPTPYPDEGGDETVRADQVTDADLGQYLSDVNHESVSYRYSHREKATRPEPFRMDTKRRTEPCEPVQVIKAVHCYRYQACEHPGWKDSPADRLMQTLESEYISKLPGYNAAAWEIS